jgi:phosphopantothenoylcysteine decarboxylase/phosphopantothenate--cysteine ligase
MSSNGRRVLLGITGSIAAVKTPELVRQLRDRSFQVSVVMTKSAEQFVSTLALSTFCGEKTISDMFDFEFHRMPHLQLSAEADVMVIAPITATILARCVYGLAEDMVTLSFMNTTAPVLMAPAMHTTMWEHPATQLNVKTLKERGVLFVGPYQGPLADYSRGEGRMAEVEEIINSIERLLSSRSPQNK